MYSSIQPPREAAHLPIPQQLQPDDRAGTVYDRVERRRPYDRRRQDRAVVFEMRANARERRKQRRRPVYDRSRRWPEPPQEIDVWA